MKAPYRYSLKKNDNTWYCLVNRMPAESTTPYYFIFGFISNWQDIGISDERNMRMFGFFRNYSEDNYQFVNDGATLLRQLWDSLGNNGKVKLVVEQLDASTQDYIFNYQTDVNFSSIIDKRNSLEAKVMEDSIPAKIKSREDIVYEIPLSGNDAQVIACKPLRVLGYVKWTTGWPIPGETSTGAVAQSGTVPGYKIPIYYTTKTIVPVSDTPDSQPISVPDPSSNNNVTGQNFEQLNISTGLPVNYNNYLLRANIPLLNMVFKGTINYYVDNQSGHGPGHYKAYLARVNAAHTSFIVIDVQTSPPIANSTQLNSAFSFDTAKFSMQPGETLILFFDFALTGINSHAFAIAKDSELSVHFEHFTDNFTVKGMSWYNIGKQLIAKITDNEATFASRLLTTPINYSDYYDLKPSELFMLSGDSIRGITDARIKISLKNYLKASTVMMATGFGIEGNIVRLERIEYFFRNTSNDLIAHLDDIQDCEISAASEFNYNTIDIGYREYEYDDINGKDEPNASRQYSTSVTNDKLAIDLISPIRADGYGIFYTWVQYALSDDKDSKSDNDLFALQTIPLSVPFAGALRRAMYAGDISSSTSITGLLEPNNTMNLGLTPLRNALRLGRYIQSWYYGQDSDALKYQTTSRNDKLAAKLSGTTMLKESADVSFSMLGARLFYPRYLSVKVNSLNNYRLLWDAKRNGYFTLKWKGKTYKAYPVKSAERNALPKIVTFKLLAADLGV